MDEEFGSFVVTDPDLVDEGIDVSGLRTKTDTSLLGNIPELAGVQYEAFNPNRLTDLMRFYQTGLPAKRDEAKTTISPATGGGGTGGGGPGTAPITTPVTTPVTTPTTTSPFVETSPNVLSATDPVTGQPTSGNIVDPRTGDVFAPGDYSDVAGTLADPREKIDLVTEQDLADNTSLLQKLGLPADFDIKKAALEAGINLKVGAPVSLIAKGLGAVFPGGIENTTKVARETGLLVGDGTVTQDIYGINTQSQFGNYDQYNIEQVDKLQNRLDELNPDTNPDSKYKTQEDYLKNTKRLRQELEDRNKYLDKKGLKGVGDVDSGRGSGLRPTVDDATGVNPFADIDTGVGEFDTTPVTGVTRPGTVLGKPGIERFDDAEASIDMFDDTPPGASTTGTPIDALNPINRQQHFDNTEKLKDAVRAGEITPEEYNRLSAFDATKTMGLGPVTGTASAIGYQAVQTLAGDQNVSDFIGDTARNIQGVSGNITPEEQVKYQEIITGEKIYRDPILDMVDQPKKGTLAGVGDLPDISDEFAMFDLPEPTTPIATDQIGTFDADTFDDNVSFVGPQPITTELTDSDFTAQDRQDIFNRERELENEYIEETGKVPTPDRFLGQAINEIADKKRTVPTSITPLEDDFKSLVGPTADDDPAPTPPAPEPDRGGPPSVISRPDPAPQDTPDRNRGGPPSVISRPAPSLPTYGPPSQSGGAAVAAVAAVAAAVAAARSSAP